MDKTYIIDLTERVTATFIGAAAASLAADAADIADLSVWQGAAVSGLAAVVSLLKGLAARYVGDSSAGMR